MRTGPILCLVLGIALLDVIAGQIQPRIVNGYASVISDMKHLINLRRDGKFSCGASLIRPSWVLTAAHCIEGYGASRFTVVGGQTYLNSGGVSRRVSTIYYSSKYDNTSVTWDVALLRLASPMTGTNIATIPLCDVQLPAGTKVKVSGWGKTSEEGTSSSNQVLSIDVTTISRATCQSAFWGNEITTTMMCTSTSGSKDACSGDSGGPMIYNNKLHGIVSWGVGCARPNYPAVFTDVCSPEIKKYIEYIINKYS